MAWNFVNDSLSTTVCLQWEPEVIAIALIHLASKLSKFTVSDWIGRQSTHLRWWDMFVADVEMEVLEDICHQVLDLYQQVPAPGSIPESPPQLPPSKCSPPMKRANLGGGGVVIDVSGSRTSPGMPIKSIEEAKKESLMIPTGAAVGLMANKPPIDPHYASYYGQQQQQPPPPYSSGHALHGGMSGGPPGPPPPAGPPMYAAAHPYAPAGHYGGGGAPGQNQMGSGGPYYPPPPSAYYPPP